MNKPQTGFLPGSKPDWRKRLASVTRYIDDLESCLSRANAIIVSQEHCIDDLRRLVSLQVSRLETEKTGARL